VSAPEVLCVGELMWDLHGTTADSLEVVPGFRRRLGGAAANVAVELRGLQVPTAVAGVVARDAFGRGLRQALDARGIDTSALVERRGRTGLVFIQGGVEAESFLSYRPAFARYPTRLPLPRAWRPRPPARAIVHLAALDPDPASLAALSALAREATALGCRLSIDLNARPLPWRARRGLPARAQRLLSRADLVKVSADDLARVGLGDHAGDAVAARAALAMESGTLVLTRGPGVVRAAGPWGRCQVAPQRERCRQALGAGDVFCAALLAVLAEDEASPTRAGWRRALARANAHAGAWLGAHGRK
jgi:sugar/nucleoside kinase (ribokinase family)